MKEHIFCRKNFFSLIKFFFLKTKYFYDDRKSFSVSFQLDSVYLNIVIEIALTYCTITDPPPPPAAAAASTDFSNSSFFKIQNVKC